MSRSTILFWLLLFVAACSQPKPKQFHEIVDAVRTGDAALLQGYFAPEVTYSFASASSLFQRRTGYDSFDQKRGELYRQVFTRWFHPQILSFQEAFAGGRINFFVDDAAFTQITAVPPAPSVHTYGIILDCHQKPCVIKAFQVFPH